MSTRAWPPAPNVQSITVSPGRTLRSSRTSLASTGTCGALGACKAFRNKLGAPFDLGELAAPGLAVPDLEPVTETGDDDVLAERSMLQQRRGQRHAPLAVELGLLRGPEQ